ncbi:MAG TPA: glycosyltransferase [Conexibacter sp.]|nr:glycosyltransferase [Conexibacter sp.]
MPTVAAPQISVIIPAYNEMSALPVTLARVAAARAVYADATGKTTEVIVVDNRSTDRTADVARAHGVEVVSEERAGIAQARNAGAKAATAPWLFFLDADTLVPPEILSAIDAALSDPVCVGGAPATRYDVRKRSLHGLMWIWTIVARTFQMTQGVGQFVTAEAFAAIGGYNEQRAMAEDTLFNSSLRRLAKARNGTTAYLEQVVIEPSSRRYDEWPVCKTYALTNPLSTLLLRRIPWLWQRAWREDAPR